MRYGKWKRALGTLLAAILICVSFAGCSKGGDDKDSSGDSQGKGTQSAGEQAVGRFLEEELDTGVVFGKIYDLRKLEDGSLRIVGADRENENAGVWESSDAGKTWKNIYNLPAEVQKSSHLWLAALSPSGQIVCAVDKYISGEAHLVLYLVDKEGKANEMSFELPAVEGGGGSTVSKSTEERNFAFDLQFPGDDWVMLEDIYGKVYQINASDSSVKYTYDFTVGEMEAAFPMYAVGDTLLKQDGTQVICYDMQTGEQESSEEILGQNGLQNGFFSAIDTLDGGESIYCLSKGGVFYYKFGGSVMEQLIDGSMNSLGVPSFALKALAMIDEQNLLVAAENTDSSSGSRACILKYTYSADTSAKQEKELKVFSLYDNTEIRQSISRFKKEHTDVQINYQVAFSEDNGMNVSDVLKTLTTEVMAGNGPDLLILDGMPVETYIEKGVLKDLSALMKESGGNYFENILNTYQDAQGQMCAVPARFMIPMIQAGSKYFEPGEDFNAFMERKETMVNMDPKTVVEKFWYTCGAAWQKEDKTLDESKITEFLTKLKNAYGEYDPNVESDKGVCMSLEGGGFVDLTSKSFFVGHVKLLSGDWNTNFGLYGELFYGIEEMVNEVLENGNIDLMPGQADHVFVPAMVLGISSRSAQPELAEAFVKYLFSQEAQQILQYGGFPVEKESFHSAIDGHQYGDPDRDMGGGFSDSKGREFIYTHKPTPEEEIARMTELVESLETRALQDDVIKEVVIEQGEKVLKGELSPEEAAAAIIQKVNIYLME